MSERTGVEMIAEERRRQVESEGWTPEHDDDHRGGQLAIAAACYAIPEKAREGRVGGRVASVTFDILRWLWPWQEPQYRGPIWLRWWKPTPDDRVRELVKAGALIAAEIDRLNRAARTTERTDG